MLLVGWLGGASSETKAGELLTIEQVGERLGGKSWLILKVYGSAKLMWMSTVPVNVKDRDVFHLTIEEYLQALITLIEELVREPLFRWFFQYDCSYADIDYVRPVWPSTR